MNIGILGNITEKQIQTFQSLWPTYKIDVLPEKCDISDFKANNALFTEPSSKDNTFYPQTPLSYLVPWIVNNLTLKEITDDEVTNARFAWLDMVSYFDVLFYLEPEKIETDEQLIWKALVQSYEQNIGSFFPKEDCPAVITLSGPEDLKIPQIQLYVTADGESFGEDQSLVDFNELLINSSGNEN